MIRNLNYNDGLNYKKEKTRGYRFGCKINELDGENRACKGFVFNPLGNENFEIESV